ncbi:hypothetical protein L1049_011772 [Liquidambar formosana]|uniref:Cation/H+ exchanger domain-containing protein n=1 Tax=Liquidambar formosana TaxID=63359 RepID=A0AAP0X3B1_LIQFO
MFFFFAMGVKMDLRMMFQPEAKAVAIGISVYFFTSTIPLIICFILTTYSSMDTALANSIPYIAVSQASTAFPVISHLLTELKIINTDIGRLAVSSALFCDAIGISLTAVVLSIAGNKDKNVMTTVWAILSYAGLVAIIIAFPIRPTLLCMQKHASLGKAVPETFIVIIFVAVLVTAFLSEIVGQHFILGPLLLGLAVPAGPPLGDALELKLHSLCVEFLYPIFLAVSGMKTNVLKINFQGLWVVGTLVFFSFLVKIGAVMAPAMYHNVPVQEAVVVALALNAKGITELVIFILLKEKGILTDQAFALSVIQVVVTTAIITPLIRVLYSSPRQCISIQRNSIQHAKRNTELRVLVCIHNQESIPTILNLLEVSHATRESPVAVIGFLLVEPVGQTTPMLLAHQLQRKPGRFAHVFNALHHYELQNKSCATVQLFTAISKFEAMHDDICQVALDKRATIVILPYHKQWAIDGTIGSVNGAVRNMNLRVLHKAPCSVGILIERGVLTGTLSVLTNRSWYQIAVLFIGGQDDVESLAYGARMAKHSSTNLTVFRFLLFGSEESRGPKPDDDDLIDEVRYANRGNDHFEYIEEVVIDGIGLAALIRRMEDCFDLMIVGRRHQESPILSRLGEWSECPELGVIGDMLASPDFGSISLLHFLRSYQEETPFMEIVPSESANEMLLVMANMTLVCENPNNIQSKGIWSQSNPLNFSTPLLLCQISIISIISQLIGFCLKPLGQSSIVSQIFGGMLLGPSLLGHDKALSLTLFPTRGNAMIELIATFGLMFFFFLIGVKMDPIMMLRPGKKAMGIGFSVFFFTLTLPSILCFILKNYLTMDTSLAHSLPFITISQSITAFPVIVCLLTELKFLNTELGRLAVSSAMFCDVISISLTAIVYSISENKGGNAMTTIWALVSYVAFFATIAFTVRPTVLWMLNPGPEGKSVDETCIFIILALVLVVGFVSETIGQHFILGPLIFGLAVPEGPPLGAALESRLDTLISGLLYPIFLAVSGLKTNVFAIKSEAVWVVTIIVVFACLVKIGAVILPAIYSDVPIREALVLGLVLNAKGINELILYNYFRQSEILKDQEFALAVISVVVVTAIITPLIKLLYDPQNQYISTKRNTIQHAKPDAELRILVCIHNHDTVPTIINLLEVSHATRESPVAVITVFLVELVGRSAPMLVTHERFDKTFLRNVCSSGHIVNAFQHYELQNQTCVTVQSFTAMSHLETMHDDILQMALDKKATIVIIPFHKQWAIDGSIGSVNRAIQNMNLNVLNKVPCSVGILVDRGILTGSSSILTCRLLYRVGILFIGGADDAESLAYGCRMAKHRRTNLTVIRFLLFGSENNLDRKHDTVLIEEFRQANIDNKRFVFIEEVVRDGEGLAALIRGMEDCFDLMIVGRQHQDSPLFSGLDEWSECPELGVIGDMLASPDFGITASVLVVQQQRVGRNVNNWPTQGQPVLNDREPLFNHDVRHEGDTTTMV